MELAEKYEALIKTNSTVCKFFESTIDFIFGNLKFTKNDIVLDYGCGTGEVIAQYISPYVSTVYGVDISPEMINMAKATNRISKNVEFVFGDFTTLDKHFEQLKSTSEIFDKVLAIYVINFFEDML